MDPTPLASPVGRWVYAPGGLRMGALEAMAPARARLPMASAAQLEHLARTDGEAFVARLNETVQAIWSALFGTDLGGARVPPPPAPRITRQPLGWSGPQRDPHQGATFDPQSWLIVLDSSIVDPARLTSTLAHQLAHAEQWLVWYSVQPTEVALNPDVERWASANAADVFGPTARAAARLMLTEHLTGELDRRADAMNAAFAREERSRQFRRRWQTYRSSLTEGAAFVAQDAWVALAPAAERLVDRLRELNAGYGTTYPVDDLAEVQPILSAVERLLWEYGVAVALSPAQIWAARHDRVLVHGVQAVNTMWREPFAGPFSGERSVLAYLDRDRVVLAAGSLTEVLAGAPLEVVRQRVARATAYRNDQGLDRDAPVEPLPVPIRGPVRWRDIGAVAYPAAPGEPADGALIWHDPRKLWLIATDGPARDEFLTTRARGLYRIGSLLEFVPVDVDLAGWLDRLAAPGTPPGIASREQLRQLARDVGVQDPSPAESLRRLWQMARRRRHEARSGKHDGEAGRDLLRRRGITESLWQPVLDDADRVVASAPRGFEATAVPGGLAIRPAGTPVPKHVTNAYPLGELLSVFLVTPPGGPAPDLAETAGQVLSALFGAMPLNVLLLVGGAGDRPVPPDEALADRVAEQLTVGSVVSAALRWQVTGDHEVDFTRANVPSLAIGRSPDPADTAAHPEWDIARSSTVGFVGADGQVSGLTRFMVRPWLRRAGIPIDHDLLSGPDALAVVVWPRRTGGLARDDWQAVFRPGEAAAFVAWVRATLGRAAAAYPSAAPLLEPGHAQPATSGANADGDDVGVWVFTPGGLRMGDPQTATRVLAQLPTLHADLERARTLTDDEAFAELMTDLVQRMWSAVFAAGPSAVPPPAPRTVRYEGDFRGLFAPDSWEVHLDTRRLTQLEPSLLAHELAHAEQDLALWTAGLGQPAGGARRIPFGAPDAVWRWVRAHGRTWFGETALRAGELMLEEPEPVPRADLLLHALRAEGNGAKYRTRWQTLRSSFREGPAMAAQAVWEQAVRAAAAGTAHAAPGAAQAGPHAAQAGPATLVDRLREVNEAFGTTYPVDYPEPMENLLADVEELLRRHGVAVSLSPQEVWAKRHDPAAWETSDWHTEVPASSAPRLEEHYGERPVQAYLTTNAVTKLFGPPELARSGRYGLVTFLGRAPLAVVRERVAWATEYAHDDGVEPGGSSTPLPVQVRGAVMWWEVDRVDVYWGAVEGRPEEGGLTRGHAEALAESIRHARYLRPGTRVTVREELGTPGEAARQQAARARDWYGVDLPDGLLRPADRDLVDWLDRVAAPDAPPGYASAQQLAGLAGDAGVPQPSTPALWRAARLARSGLGAPDEGARQRLARAVADTPWWQSALDDPHLVGRSSPPGFSLVGLAGVAALLDGGGTLPEDIYRRTPPRDALEVYVVALPGRPVAELAGAVGHALRGRYGSIPPPVKVFVRGADGPVTEPLGRDGTATLGQRIGDELGPDADVRVAAGPWQVDEAGAVTVVGAGETFHRRPPVLVKLLARLPEDRAADFEQRLADLQGRRQRAAHSSLAPVAAANELREVEAGLAALTNDAARAAFEHAREELDRALAGAAEGLSAADDRLRGELLRRGHTAHPAGTSRGRRATEAVSVADGLLRLAGAVAQDRYDAARQLLNEHLRDLDADERSAVDRMAADPPATLRVGAAAAAERMEAAAAFARDLATDFSYWDVREAFDSLVQELDDPRDLPDRANRIAAQRLDLLGGTWPSGYADHMAELREVSIELGGLAREAYDARETQDGHTPWLRDRAVRDADQRDRGLVFAPPEYAFRRDGRGVTPNLIAAQVPAEGTAEGMVWATVRAVVKAVLGSEYRAVEDVLDALLTESKFVGGMDQLLGDHLLLDLGSVQVEVTLLLGDWEQVTGPRGEVLHPDRHRHLPLRSNGEVRIRPRDEAKIRLGTTRSYLSRTTVEARAGGARLPGAAGLTSAGGSGMLPRLHLNDSTMTRVVNPGTSEARYVKGSSYRAVQFLHDSGVFVSVVKDANRSRHAQMLPKSLVVGYQREIARHRPRPRGARGVMSHEWAKMAGHPETTTSADIRDLVNRVRTGDSDAPDPPPRPAPDPSAPPIAWGPPGPAEQRTAHRHTLPLTWVDTVEGVNLLRQAALSLLPARLARPGSASRGVLISVLSINNLKGGVLAMMERDGYLSPVLTDDRVGATRAALLFTATVTRSWVRESDGVRFDNDTFTRVDSEDVGRGNAVEKHTYGNTRAFENHHSGTLALLRYLPLVVTLIAFRFVISAALALTVSLLLGFVAMQNGTTTGGGVGAVLTRRLRFRPGRHGEPQAQGWHDFDVTVTNLVTGGQVTVALRVLGRHLRIDAVDLPRLQLPRQLPASAPGSSRGTSGGESDDEYSAGEEKATRAAPGRVLVLPPDFDRWLPSFVPIDGFSDNVADVLDNAVALVLEHFPSYLPGVYLLPPPRDPNIRVTSTRARFDETVGDVGLANFQTLFQAMNSSALAGKAPTAVSRGIQVTLTAPGAGALMLTVYLRFDRTRQRHQRAGIDVAHEIYNGANVPLTTTTMEQMQFPLSIDLPGPAWFNFGRGTVEAGLTFEATVNRNVTSESGVNLTGAVGAIAWWGARFRGPYEFHVTAREERRRLRSMVMPGAFPPEPGNDPERAMDVEEATGTVREAPPVRVEGTLHVPEDLLDAVQLPAGTRLADLSTEELYQLPTKRAVRGDERLGRAFFPSNGPDAMDDERLPQDALYLANSGPAHRLAVGLLRSLGPRVLTPDAEQALGQHMGTVEQNFRDHALGRPVPVWRTDRTELEPRVPGAVGAEVMLQIAVPRLEPRGTVPEFSRYLHGTATAVRGREVSKEWSVRVSGPNFALRLLAAGLLWTGIGPLFGLFGLGGGRRSKRQSHGSWDNVQLDLHGGFWARVPVNWQVTVRAFPAVDPDPAAGTTRSGTARSRGLALLTHQAAQDRGLAPREEEENLSDAFPGRHSRRQWQPEPDRVAAVPTNSHPLPMTRQPAAHHLLNSVADGGIVEVPDLHRLPQEVYDHLRNHGAGPREAALVRTQLQKLALLVATYAGLADMQAGLPLPMVGSRTWTTVTQIRTTVTVEVPDHRYAGQSGFQLVEPKTAAGFELSRGRRTASSLGFAAAWSNLQALSGTFLRAFTFELRARFTRTVARDAARSDGTEKVLVLRQIDANHEMPPEGFRFDTKVTVSFERADSPTGFFRLLSVPLTLLGLERYGWRNSFSTIEPYRVVEKDSLLVALPYLVTRIHPLAPLRDPLETTDGTAHTLVRKVLLMVDVPLPPPRRPEPVVRGPEPVPAANRRSWRSGLRLDAGRVTSEAQLIDEAFVAAVRTAAQGLVPRPSVLQPQTSWMDQRQQVAVAVTRAFFAGNFHQMLQRDGAQVPIGDSTMYLALDIERVEEYDLDGRVTQPGTIPKDLHAESAEATVTHSSGWRVTGSLTGGIGVASGARAVPEPDYSRLKLVPLGSTLAHTVGVEDRVLAGKAGATRETGVTTSGRDYTKLTAPQATLRVEFAGRAVTVTVTRDAVVFKAPTETVSGIVNAPLWTGQPASAPPHPGYDGDLRSRVRQRWDWFERQAPGDRDQRQSGLRLIEAAVRALPAGDRDLPSVLGQHHGQLRRALDELGRRAGELAELPFDESELVDELSGRRLRELADRLDWLAEASEAVLATIGSLRDDLRDTPVPEATVDRLRSVRANAAVELARVPDPERRFDAWALALDGVAEVGVATAAMVAAEQRAELDEVRRLREAVQRVSDERWSINVADASASMWAAVTALDPLERLREANDALLAHDRRFDAAMSGHVAVLAEMLRRQRTQLASDRRRWSVVRNVTVHIGEWLDSVPWRETDQRRATLQRAVSGFHQARDEAAPWTSPAGGRIPHARAYDLAHGIARLSRLHEAHGDRRRAVLAVGDGLRRDAPALRPPEPELVATTRRDLLELAARAGELEAGRETIHDRAERARSRLHDLLAYDWEVDDAYDRLDQAGVEVTENPPADPAPDVTAVYAASGRQVLTLHDQLTRRIRALTNWEGAVDAAERAIREAAASEPGPHLAPESGRAAPRTVVVPPQPWTSAELLDLARLSGAEPDGTAVWFDTGDLRVQEAAERPVPAGLLRVHAQSRDGTVVVGDRRVHPDVLAETLVDLGLARSRVQLAVGPAGEGVFTANMRGALSRTLREAGHDGAGVMVDQAPPQSGMAARALLDPAPGGGDGAGGTRPRGGGVLVGVGLRRPPGPGWPGAGVAVVRSHGELVGVMRQVTGVVAPSGDNCVVLEHELIRRLHPGGLSAAGTVDDLAVDMERVWHRSPGRRELERLVWHLGEGALARVSVRFPAVRPVRPGHRILLYHGRDGLWYVDPAVSTVEGPGEFVLPSGAEVFAQVYSGRGQEVRDPFGAGWGRRWGAVPAAVLGAAGRGVADVVGARLAEVWAGAGPDRADAGVLGVLVRVVGGGVVGRAEVPGLRDGAARWAWIMVVQDLVRRYPHRRSALRRVQVALAAC
jgi:hypothetical protein